MPSQPTVRLARAFRLAIAVLVTLSLALAPAAGWAADGKKAGKSKRKAKPAAAASQTEFGKGDKLIVFIAGGPSHGYAAHTHYAGCVLLAKAIAENVPNTRTVVHRNGWPTDPKALEGAAAIVVYSDGGGGHPIIPHLDELEPRRQAG